MAIDTNPAATVYDGAPLVLRDAEGNPLPFPPTANGHAVLHIKQPQAPDFRFEWHPGVSKVYFIRLGALPLIGEMLASNIMTHGDALTAVWIWLRGYREGKTPQLGILAE